MLYTSTKNQRIRQLKKLNQKKYRDESNEFLIEGEHLVQEAYQKGFLKELFLKQGIDFKLDVKTSYITNDVLKYVSNLDNSSGIIGLCDKINSDTIGNKVLILDEIQDPGNLGTIIRSAVAFNIDSIILSDNTVDLYNDKVLRATQGMIFNINIIKKNLLSFIPELKNNGYKIYGTRVNCGKNLKNIEKNKKFAIIVGNEGNGIKKDILNLCSDYIYIDMNKNCESLNVAVATSIILYELDK